MEFDWVEWFGYLASMVVLVSLTMTSIIKLRVINFTGCLLFAAFAYFIDSYPTMLMNLGIAGINVYFLYHLYYQKEQFKLIATSTDSEYFEHFISVNRANIEDQITIAELEQSNTVFYMLRDNAIVGLLAGSLVSQNAIAESSLTDSNSESSDTIRQESGDFEVLLDYVRPQYQDMKVAQYFYHKHPEELKQRGITRLISQARTPEHHQYLTALGFEQSPESNQRYIMTLL